MYLGIWLPDLTPLDKNAPQSYLQKGITPFGHHYAGANSGPAVSTFFSKFARILEKIIGNIISNDHILSKEKTKFLLYTLL